MNSRDYTKEIGLNKGDRIVPLPYAIAILATLAVGGWLGLSSLKTAAPEHSRTEKTAQTASAPAHTLAVSK